MKSIFRLFFVLLLGLMAPLRLVPAAPANGLDGVWTAQQTGPGSAAPIGAMLDFNGARGSMRVGAESWPLFDVNKMGADVTFTLVIPGSPYVTIHYRGAIEGDGLTLASLDEGQGVFRLNARRAGAAAMAQGVAAPAAPELPAGAPASESRSALLNPPPPAPSPAPPTQAAAPRQASPAPIASAPARNATALRALRDLPSNGLAKTPLMGWASRQKLGSEMDDDAIRQAAEGMEESGLRVAGYVYLEIGDGWQGTRDASGMLSGNQKFPDMRSLGDYIHAKGLKFGLQISAGAQSCGGFEGSYGHESEDAKTFADWGVDYLVYDWCGAETIYPTQAEQQAAYQKMAEALRSSGRDIIFGVSGAPDAARWGAKAGANLWRSGPDVKDDWRVVSETGFSQNGKEAFAGPGRWNDPGLIQAGNGAMTPDEYRSQLNLWAVLAAPLMLGNDVRIMTRETVALLTNEEVIAVDQDALGSQAKRVARDGQTEVWARPLADGSMAVAFFNRGDQSAPVAISWQQLGVDGPRRVRDLWWHQNLGTANGRYAVYLTAHTSLLLRLSR